MQYEICKGTSVAVSSKVKEAQIVLEKLTKKRMQLEIKTQSNIEQEIKKLIASNTSGRDDDSKDILANVQTDSNVKPCCSATQIKLKSILKDKANKPLPKLTQSSEDLNPTVNEEILIVNAKPIISPNSCTSTIGTISKSADITSIDKPQLELNQKSKLKTDANTEDKAQ